MREMKNSGIEWIGDIPSEWDTSRLQWLVYEIKESNNPIKTTQVLSLTNKLGVVPYEDKGNQGNKAKEDYSQYGLAFENTLVINSMNVLIGSVGISKYFGCVSPVYYVFRNTENSDLRYINYIFQNVGFQKELRKYANGILEIRLRISAHDMLRRIVPCPSLCEQIKIADFLDENCAEIDTVIEKTKATIEEYKKLKQSVITQAVTKGIRPNRPMKDSGIEWIGEIPADWDKSKIKNIVLSLESGVSVNAADIPVENSTQFGVLKTSSVSKFLFVPSEHKQVNIEEYERVSCPVRKNTIIVSRMNTPELVGACGYVDDDYPNLFLPDRLWQITLSESIVTKFVWYYLINQKVRSYISSLSSGTSSSMQNISKPQFDSIILLLPNKSEQQEIVNYLDKKCSEIDELIAKKTSLLSELESYKKSLIYEYVTGKKEVTQ